MESGGASGGGKTISLDVNETNSLREKLGLKPLEEDSAAPGSTVGEEAKAVANLKEYREAKEDEQRKKDMKAKILASREERKLAKSFGGQGLGDTWTENADNMGSFLSAMNALKKKKDATLQRYDEEEEEALGDVPTKPTNNYTSEDIAGMTVGHDLESFEAGTTQILTLKDESILGGAEGGGEGPALVSADVSYQERAKRSVEAKQRGTKYNPYADEDHEGGLRPPGAQKKMLSKYDEVIDKNATPKFELNAKGGLNKKDAEADDVVGRLRAETAAVERREIAEFYTKDEAVKFQKKKKKKKGSKRSTIDDTTDEQQSAKDKAAQEALEVAMRGEVADGKDETGDHGSRSRKRARLAVRMSKPVSTQADGAIVASTSKVRKIAAKTMVKVPLLVEEDDDDDYTLVERQEELLRGRDSDDGEADELASMLARTKKRSKMRQVLTEQQVEAMVDDPEGANGNVNDDGVGDSSGAMEISTTDGFFRGIARVHTTDAEKDPAAVPSENRDGENAGDGDDMEVDGAEPEPEPEAEKVEGEQDERSNAQKDKKDDNQTSVVSEPVAARGMAAAWNVAVSRGFVKKAKVHETKGTLKAIADTVGAAKKSKTDDRGRLISNPLDIEGYVPEAKLSYKDEFGNEQTAHEAWVSLNHVFHGNGHKRGVREKIMKKQERLKKREKMLQTDTPTGMVAAVEALKRESGQAHVVLDGSGAGAALHKTLKVAKRNKSAK